MDDTLSRLEYRRGMASCVELHSTYYSVALLCFRLPITLVGQLSSLQNSETTYYPPFKPVATVFHFYQNWDVIA